MNPCRACSSKPGRPDSFTQTHDSALYCRRSWRRCCFRNAPNITSRDAMKLVERYTNGWLAIFAEVPYERLDVRSQVAWPVRRLNIINWKDRVPVVLASQYSTSPVVSASEMPCSMCSPWQSNSRAAMASWLSQHVRVTVAASLCASHS